MKAEITQTGSYTVTLAYDDAITGERVTREFWIPLNSGRKYVREGDIQVCDELSPSGNTLSVSDPPELLPLIRRQWKAWQAAKRKGNVTW